MLTSEEKQLKTALNILALCFALAGLSFLFAQNFLLNNINQLTQHFFPHLATLSLSTEKFWLVLTSSMMLMITVLSLLAAMDVRKKKDYCYFVLLSKACSTFLFIVFFFEQGRIPAYLVGALTDGSIFVILFILCHRAYRGRSL